jgi:hypothetical protein
LDAVGLSQLFRVAGLDRERTGTNPAFNIRLKRSVVRGSA